MKKRTQNEVRARSTPTDDSRRSSTRRRPYGLIIGLAAVISACAAGSGTNTGSGGIGGSGSRQGSNLGGATSGQGGAGSGSDPGSGSGSIGSAGSSTGGSTSSSGAGSSGTGSHAGTGGGSGSAGSGNGAGSGSASGSSSGTGIVGNTDGGSAGCQGETLPATSDYSMNGPFATTTMDGTGPGGTYTVFQPSTLGQNGFKHPIATWGNGITTTPQIYPGLLGAVASHGFVVIASDSSSDTAQDLTSGLDWMIMQNSASGPYQGMLNTTCLVTIGYSLGGGAAVTAGSHQDVVATVSMHGVTGTSSALHAPLLLFTSTQDTFVTASGFVQPTFDMSAVPTFYATLVGAGDNGHLTPILDAGPERAPTIAWLRYWVYGDQGARSYFYGSSCTLCGKDPWGPAQTKPAGFFQ